MTSPPIARRNRVWDTKPLLRVGDYFTYVTSLHARTSTAGIVRQSAAMTDVFAKLRARAA